MNNQDYEQKKRECWEEFRALDRKSPYSLREVNAFAFDKGYALGKQEKDADTVIQGWVARDKKGTICLYNECPERFYAPINEWGTDYPLQYYCLPKSYSPDLTWDDDPEPVEIIIKRKKI